MDGSRILFSTRQIIDNQYFMLDFNDFRPEILPLEKYCNYILLIVCITRFIERNRSEVN